MGETKMLYLMCTLQTLGVKTRESLGQRRDDRGQTAAEYLGIIAVAAAVIVAVVGTEIDTKISDALEEQITKILDAVNK
jgi:pilus assembly protein Flp/PilA